jgi:hypothetical protein
MSPAKKSSGQKRKKTNKKFSANLQQRHPVKKYPSRPKSGNVELNESTPVPPDEHDKPVIIPTK